MRFRQKKGNNRGQWEVLPVFLPCVQTLRCARRYVPFFHFCARLYFSRLFLDTPYVPCLSFSLFWSYSWGSHSRVVVPVDVPKPATTEHVCLY